MGFSCGGSTFTNLSLDYSTSNELYASVTAVNAWDADTEVEVTASIGGQEMIDETFKICDHLATNSVACQATGTVVLDLSSFLPNGADSTTMAALITSANISIEANPNGSTETCTKGSASLAYKSAKADAAGYVVGAAALVGLAAYAVRRKKRAAPPKNSSKRQKLFEGEMA